MPCWDSLLYTKTSTPYGNAKSQEESPEIKHLESRIHKLTEMLCELCSRVEAGWPSVFVENTELSAREIVEKGLHIAADICIYSNHNLTIEEL